MAPSSNRARTKNCSRAAARMPGSFLPRQNDTERRARLMKLKAILADNAYLLKIVFRHARGYAALTVCTAILIAADNVAANALMPRYLTDALARRAPLREICSVLALMATLLCARFTLRALQEKCLRPRAL